MAPFARHIHSNMKIVDIRIPPETIEIESGRPTGEMNYDDFLWCLGAEFSFLESSLLIEAPLFGFVRRFIAAAAEAENGRGAVVLNDEYGSYQLTFNAQSEGLSVSDAFGGGAFLAPQDELRSALQIELSNVTESLEAVLPELLDNLFYRQLKEEIGRELV